MQLTKFIAEARKQMAWADAADDLTVQASRSLKIAFEYMPRLLDALEAQDKALEYVQDSWPGKERDKTDAAVARETRKRVGEILEVENE